MFLVVMTSALPAAAQTTAEAGPRTEGVSALSASKPFAEFSASAERLRESIVSKAREAVGARYKLGGTRIGTGFDCSGLVQYAMSALNMVLPRTAQSQSKVGVEIPKDVSALEPGDVLTFGTGKRISHVGIYVGDGKMIHASTTRRKVIETSIENRRSPLIRQWKGVRRLVDSRTALSLDSLLALADTLR